jgi:hypothetical protein
VQGEEQQWLIAARSSEFVYGFEALKISVKLHAVQYTNITVKT